MCNSSVKGLDASLNVREWLVVVRRNLSTGLYTIYLGYIYIIYVHTGVLIRAATELYIMHAYADVYTPTIRATGYNDSHRVAIAPSRYSHLAERAPKERDRRERERSNCMEI